MLEHEIHKILFPKNFKLYSISIGQPLYTEEMPRKFNMDQAKPMKTPVNASQKANSGY